MPHIKNVLKKLAYVFSTEKSNYLRRHKLILAKTLLHIRDQRKKFFGLFVIFNWQNKWNAQYADIHDTTQDIFAKHERNIFHAKNIKKIAATIKFDGAILVTKRGIILHSGIFIEGLSPRRLAIKKSSNNRHLDLSTRLGFKTKVHTRHLSAITASWELKGTTVYTISEETGDMHIFEAGRIIFSTVPGEGINI